MTHHSLQENVKLICVFILKVALAKSMYYLDEAIQLVDRPMAMPQL